jgi:hypothetical protein
MAFANDSLMQTDINFRVVVAAAAFGTGNGSYVRFRLRGNSAQPFWVQALTIGDQAATGDAYDMAATPVAITVGGASSFTLAAGADIWSDWIAFTWDHTKAKVWAIAGTGHLRYQNSAGTNFNYYTASGVVSSANTADTSGLTIAASPNRCYMIEEIQVASSLTAGSAMTVKSQDINLSAAPDWGLLLAFVNLNGATLNTDIIFSLSRDGTNFTTLTMTTLYTRADGSVCVSSGQTSLTSASGVLGQWKIVTANSKVPEVLAVGTQFGVN